MTHQYLYQLTLIPQPLLEENWTKRENRIINDHFNMLQSLCEAKKVTLPGRTVTMDSSGFAIVILEVDSKDEARYIMEEDPAVKEGIITARLFPFRIALSQI